MPPVDYQNTTDEQLISAIIRGDKKLLNILFDRYVKRLLRYTTLFVHSHEEASDLSQEIFVKVFKALDGYKFLGKFESWFFTIARRTIIDQHRKKKLKTFSFDSVGLNESEIPSREQSQHEELEILQTLPAREREILQLRFVEGLSYEEISEITDMNQGSLRNIVWRSVKRMQEVNSDELPKN